MDGYPIEPFWDLVCELHQRMKLDQQFQEVFSTQQFDIEYRIDNPDLVFTVGVNNGDLDLIRAESDAPAIVMEMSGESFHKLCRGLIVAPLAILSKRIKLTMKDRKRAAGSFPLTAITRRLYSEVYDEFKADGRWVPD